MQHLSDEELVALERKARDEVLGMEVADRAHAQKSKEWFKLRDEVHRRSLEAVKRAAEAERADVRAG